MVYQRQKWTDYNERKNETQNIENGAVVTSERMNYIEKGIFDNSSNSEELKRQIESTQSGMIGEFNNEAELKIAYPNGTKGYAVVWFTENGKKVGYTYTYKNKTWTKGQIWNGMGIGDEALENRMFKKKEITLNKLDLESNSILNGQMCKLGTISHLTGEYVAEKSIMASNSFTRVNKGDSVDLIDTDFLYCPFLYDLNGNFNSSKGSWENGKYTFDQDYLVKFTVKYTENDLAIVNKLSSIDNILTIPNQNLKVITNVSQIKNNTLTGEIFKDKSIKHASIDWENNSVLSGFKCVLGTFSAHTGNLEYRETIMAMTEFIEVKKGDTVEILDKRFWYVPYLWNLDGTYNSSKAAWETGVYTFKFDCLVKFVVKLTDSSTEIKNYLDDIDKIISLPEKDKKYITKSSQIESGIIEKKHLSFDINNFTISHIYLKIWANLGDSITARDWYQQLLQEKYGIISKNFGVGGSTIARNVGYSVKSFVERMYDLPDELDYLTIWGGVNDFGFGKYGFKEGSALGSFDSRDDTTFYGALHKLLEFVINKYKSQGTRIGFIITTPVSDNMGNGQKNLKGHTLEDYCQAVREVCEYYSIPYLDLQKNSGINQLNVDVMTSTFDGSSSDGLHPSRTWFGMKQYMIADFLLRL
ncbi:SGNH/GDSL hydrolase family protein [Vagococcus fluvialis]|uniref:SGNH/GDSL hydrolase family protein n=1 Tax=Vagococcus fluvialis TaxID=2738 RepID=UPI001A909784|nr:SGNH/GDSL hydrolase family protein [Vagococcus fluvialis]MBO0442841.1 SGNH/GDSL hydrolase family protein [Vagococcus fluvialis]